MRIIFGKTSSQGFTLPELAVSAAVIGALGIAVFVAKTRDSLMDTALRASTGEVLRACELAREQATSLNQIHRLRFDGVEHRLVLEPNPGDGTQAIGLGWGLNNHIFLEICNSVNANCAALAESKGQAQGAAGSDYINFYPDGTADSRNIRLLDFNGTESIVKVDRSEQRQASVRSLGD